MRIHTILVLLLALTLGACGDEPAAPDGPSGGGPSASGIAPPAPTVIEEVSLAVDPDSGFAEQAFPPVMPKAQWHESTWTAEACLECHLEGEDDAPIMKHEGMPDLAGQVACRSCHVISPDE